MKWNPSRKASLLLPGDKNLMSYKISSKFLYSRKTNEGNLLNFLIIQVKVLGTRRWLMINPGLILRRSSTYRLTK